MPISPHMRRLRAPEWGLAAVAAAIGVALIVASSALEAQIPSVPTDVEGVAIAFSPDAWGGLLIGGAALIVRALGVGWSVGVAAGVVMASIASIPTTPRGLGAIMAPLVGATCAVTWLFVVG